MRVLGPLLVVASLVIGACAPTTGGGPAATAAQETQQEVTISYWHVWGGVRLPMVEKQIAGFQAKNPKIKVEQTLISQNEMREKYLTAIASGDPPDVIMIHGQRDFPAFAANKVLVPLDDLIRQEKIDAKSVWFEAEYNTYVWDKATYALPFATGAGFFLLFWNKDHFKEAGLDPERAPRSWTELEEYARKLTVKKGAGFDRIGFDPAQGGAASNYIFREWTFLNGGNIISKDGKKILYDSPEGLAALKWMVDFYDMYGGFEKVRAMVSGPGEAYREAFQTGRVSMLVDGVFAPALFAGANPNLKYGTGLVPANDRNPKASIRNIVEGGWGYAIPKGTKHLKEAWEFLKWTTMSEGGNLEFFKAQDRPSPVIRFTNDDHFKKAAYWPVVQEAMQKSEYSPASPVQAKLNEVTLQMVQEALLRKKTPEEALKSAAAAAQKALDEWWAGRK